ncbi:hypothetical protein L208DRAFT_1248179, partial [Tricholoma matsutake]
YAHLSSVLLLQSTLDRTTILQAFQSKEQNHQHRSEVVDRARGPPNKFRRGYQGGNYGECGDKGHWKLGCPLLTNGGNANKVQEAKIEDVTEAASNASASFSHDAYSMSSNVINWNTDMGATSHMKPHKLIRNYKPCRVPINLADNHIVTIFL